MLTSVDANSASGAARSTAWTELTPAEQKLIRRLRQLHSGVHLVIITTDGSGPVSLALMDSAKSERLAPGK